MAEYMFDPKKDRAADKLAGDGSVAGNVRKARDRRSMESMDAQMDAAATSGSTFLSGTGETGHNSNGAYGPNGEEWHRKTGNE